MEQRLFETRRFLEEIREIIFFHEILAFASLTWATRELNLY